MKKQAWKILLEQLEEEIQNIQAGRDLDIKFLENRVDELEGEVDELEGEVEDLKSEIRDHECD